MLMLINKQHYIRLIKSDSVEIHDDNNISN